MTIRLHLAARLVAAAALILISSPLASCGSGSPVSLAADGSTLSTCSNGVKDGDESDRDCGGSCPACATGSHCASASDCESRFCSAGVCVACLAAQDCGADQPCQVRVCTAGACGFAPRVEGTSCGEGLVCNAQGACVGCNTASDCPGTDDECSTRTCERNVCGRAFAPAGSALAAQTAGDCRVVQCDGAGATRSVVDDADVPVDGDPCTSDLCTAGVPSNPTAAPSTPCGADRLCDAAGHCVGCLTASDCPGQDSECAQRTCTDGVCGLSFTAAGTPTATDPIAGDCHRLECDGAGGVTSAVFDTDPPANASPCHQGTCQAGVPGNPPQPSGTACGTNLLCDSAGVCVGCLVATDCAGQDTECQQRRCSAGTCEIAFTAAGAALLHQVAGDCHTVRCDGAGGITDAIDDADRPVDGNPCTGDLCTAGVPSNPPLTAGTTCGTSMLCNGAGVCVGCLAPADCGGVDTECSTRTCTAGSCGRHGTPSGTAVSQQVAGDCHTVRCDGNGATSNDVDDADLPNDLNACTRDVCANGVPSHPFEPAGTACGANKVCDGAGACVACLHASDCPGTDTECHTRTCNAGVCGVLNAAAGTTTSSQTAGDCKRGQCDGSGNIVSVNDAGDLPVDGNQCTSDLCTGGVPSNPSAAAGVPCSQNGGSVCNGSGACVQCVSASGCPGADTECRTRTCTAGVCGVANTAAGTATASQSPGDCKRNQCDGSGNIVAISDASDLPFDGNQCTSDVCNAGVPSNPSAAAGTACAQNGGSVCDGNGVCVQCRTTYDCAGSDGECQSRTCNAGACGVVYAASGTACQGGSGACDGAGTCGPASPQVSSVTPANGATASASSPIVVTFSTAMSAATLTTQASTGPCSGSIQVSSDGFSTCIGLSSPLLSTGNTVATLAAAYGLLVNTAYKLRVTTAAASSAGRGLAATFTQSTGFTTTSPDLCDDSLVISQVYAAGGNASVVPYAYDYAELHNRGATSISLSGLSLQYASATGSSWTVVVLPNRTVPAGGFFLIKLGTSNATYGAAFTADYDATGLNIGGSGKLALVRGTTAMSGTCPNLTVDLVGWGTANCSEGAAAVATTNTTSISRQVACADTNVNSADFAATTPSIRTASTSAAACQCLALNESNSASEPAYCVTQYPQSLNGSAGTASPAMYGRVYVMGITEAAGAAANIRAQFGFGPATANPEWQTGWTWTNAAYNVQAGTDDEYTATFTVPSAGSYRFAYRFSLDYGVSWTVCDNNGAGSNPNLAFDPADVAVLVSN